MTCTTLQGKYAEKLEKEVKRMNETIEKLYKKLDALDSIIDQQALEISQLKNEIKMRIEYAEKYKNEIIGSHKKIAQLKEQKKQAIEEIEHELNGHILIGDEISWNEEYYTDGKLDYKKLLIGILQTVLEILGDGNNE